ncbi:uncharacterized protein [Dysidea avara]|uniref:uncharacterized protein n=1 Tax=Dysidea avara TaxID=196820 RepID=UPI003330EE6F
MASKMMLTLVSLAMLLMFTDSQNVTMEPPTDPPTDPSTDPPSTDPPTEPSTILDLVGIKDNLCVNIELAIDTQCLNKTYNQTYTISFTKSNKQCRKQTTRAQNQCQKSMERCETLAKQLKRRDAAVSIKDCDDTSHRIQSVMTVDHLQWLCNKRAAKHFTCLREPEPGQEDLCGGGQSSCPGNTENLGRCSGPCVHPGVPGFCYCPKPDEVCIII